MPAGIYMMVVPEGMSAVVMYCQSNPSSEYSSSPSTFCTPFSDAHCSSGGMLRGAISAVLTADRDVVVDESVHDDVLDTRGRLMGAKATTDEAVDSNTMDETA